MTTLRDLSFEDEFERRVSDRTPHNRGALLHIGGLNQLFSLTVRDASDRGVGLRLHSSLPLLPVEFTVSEDGFRTVRRCRLVWRDGYFLGAALVD